MDKVIRPVRETKTTVTLKRDDYETLVAALEERDDYVAATRLMRERQDGISRNTLITPSFRQGWLQAMRDWAETLDRAMAGRQLAGFIAKRRG